MARFYGTRSSDEIDGTYYSDLIYGYEGDDRLWGYGGDDILLGGSGDDELDGGSGWDEMEGGTGSDIYIVDSYGDEVFEYAGEGTLDTIYTYLSRYSLPPEVEDLAYIGPGSFFGVGNSLNNYLYGWTGNDVLNGGLGNDTLIGDRGDDTYYVDQSGDRVIEDAGEGVDLVFTSLGSLTLAANVEELIYDGDGAFTGTGNGLNNYLEGAAGNDSLSGLAGNDVLNGRGGSDRMSGGTGNDVYIVGSSGDRVIEASGAGSDRVDSSVSHTLAANVEHLRLTGTASINGTGNGLSNTISGNSGNNTLVGLSGNDTLSAGSGSDRINGGNGNDRLTGGSGADRFFFDAIGSANADRILDFSVANDTIFLDRSDFTRITANGTLNADAFHTGSAAADAEDRIIYNEATGQLFYDSDGTGAAAAVLFANVGTDVPLTNADFIAYP